MPQTPTDGGQPVMVGKQERDSGDCTGGGDAAGGGEISPKNMTVIKVTKNKGLK